MNMSLTSCNWSDRGICLFSQQASRSISTLTGNSEMKYDDNYKISKYIGYWIGRREMMDIEKILEKVDAYFAENRGEDAEKLMISSISQAVQEQDDSGILQLLNELLGYYRETSRSEEAFRIAEQAVAQAERMGLQGTVPYATTLLNVANAYRAGGRLQESLEYYFRVQDLYSSLFSTDNMFVAGLQNNLSLLYQEMGEYGNAKICQLRALEIAQKENAAYETAVSSANLAGTCVELGELTEAEKYADRAVYLFRELGVEDSHFAAALASLGACRFRNKDYRLALDWYEQAAGIVERNIGRNEAYRRLLEHVAACRQALMDEEQDMDRPGMDQQYMGRQGMDRTEMDCAVQESSGAGLAVSRAYFETYGSPMIAEQFGEYKDKIAVGLVGRGSDCFGYDDEISRDHDWGPGFCMWVTDETYEEIGEALQQAYEQLPQEFQGFKRAKLINGKNRRGVMRISKFYRELVGAESYEEIDWRQVTDYSLAAAVNGQVFRDAEGVFTAFRNKLEKGYPEKIRYLKLAESAARFSQTAQYNFSRLLQRGDRLTARMMVWDGVKEAMKLQHYIEGKYVPHDKWLHRSMEESQAGRDVGALINEITAAIEVRGAQEKGNFDGVQTQRAGDSNVSQAIEKLGEYFAMEMYNLDLISDIDPYLDAHSQELVYKSSLAEKSVEELAEDIARLEFEAFDKVQNEGGRASCQNDWATFSIMRKSQYLTWNKTMLMQYLYDFHREYNRGHNLIEEKYGRMMESTAPERYRELKAHFPELPEEKKSIIEQVCSVQVGWMEDFALRYPSLSDNARSIHTYEDNPFNTSYETYLRGELGTYSDKMLQLYGRYIVEYARAEKNLAESIMGNSVKMYGYTTLEEAEHKISGKR